MKKVSPGKILVIALLLFFSFYFFGNEKNKDTVPKIKFVEGKMLISRLVGVIEISAYPLHIFDSAKGLVAYQKKDSSLVVLDSSATISILINYIQKNNSK